MMKKVPTILFAAAVISAIAFVAALISVIAVVHFIAFRQFQEGDRRTAELRTITPEAIREIQVYGDYDGSRRVDVPEVNSATSKALFADAMHDLSGYSPNHDKHTREFFIRMLVTSGGKHEFSVWLKPGVKGTAFMHMVERPVPEGRIHMKNLGGRKSSALYKWLEHHGLTE